MSGMDLAEHPADAQDWRQYICRACGLVYDEAMGDPDSGLTPGTRFEDIPEDWECPLCGVRKTDFELLAAHTTVAAGSSAAPPPRGLGVVIVGAGLAGRAAAEALRALDPALPITLVTACNGDVYNKPELSVAFARGLLPETLCRENGADMARRLNLRLLDGAYAIGVSPRTNTLRTTRGTLRYTHLILAQGAKPALPATLPASVAWRVNDLQGWSGLHGKLQGAPKRVAIVGGGMVGCELAEDFAQAGHTVTLLDRNEGPLAGLLPTKASQRLRHGMEIAGIRFIGPVAVRYAHRTAAGVLVTTACGQSVTVDELVAATGLATDTRLARSANLAFNRGIAVDATTLETSVKGIHALGDCISIDGAPCRFIEPISRQAQAIANHILGRGTEGYVHKAPVVRLKTRSMPLALHGVPHPDGQWRTVRDDAEHLEMEQWLGGALRSRLAA